jgi:hypothetical protein
MSASTIDTPICHAANYQQGSALLEATPRQITSMIKAKAGLTAAATGILDYNAPRSGTKSASGETQ